MKVSSFGVCQCRSRQTDKHLDERVDRREVNSKAEFMTGWTLKTCAGIKAACRRPDGRVETRWWSQSVTPNDPVTQTENKEGPQKEKQCHNPSPCPSLALGPLCASPDFILIPSTCEWAAPVCPSSCLLPPLQPCASFLSILLRALTLKSCSLVSLPPVWSGGQADGGSGRASEAWLCDNESQRTQEGVLASDTLYIFL